MAEALLKWMAGHRFDARSAGMEPRGIHPMTIQVMEEIGVSLDDHRSKSLDEFLGKVAVRYAIIVCEHAEATCPRVWPFAPQRMFWRFEDPAAFRGGADEQLEKFREVRDQIRDRHRPLVDGRGAAVTSSSMKPFVAETMGTFSLVFAGIDGMGGRLSDGGGRPAGGMDYS